MKRLFSLTLIVLLTVPAAWIGQASEQKPEGQLVGNITGIVEQREQEDGNRSVVGEFKSNVPVDKLEWKLPANLGYAINAASLPEDWKEEKRKDSILLTGPPLVHIRVRFICLKSVLPQLDRMFRKPIEFNFGLGTLDYGSRSFPVKTTPAIKQVTPNEAADIPEVIRSGNSVLITPLEVYRDGIWKLGIGDKLFDEYPNDAPLLEMTKILQYLPDRKKANEEVDRQLLQQPLLARLSQPGFGRSRVFFVPEDTKPPPDGKINLTYQNPYGETLVRGPANVILLPPLTLDPRLAAPRLFSCTPKIFQGDKLCVCGFFPTLFSRAQLLLDGKRLNAPLSGSADMITFRPENLAPGKHVITWDVPAFDQFANPEPGRLKPSASERVEFVVLAVQASIDQSKLFTGDGTTMRMKIVGTEERIPIELENATPKIIDLEGGVKQVILTSGGSNNTLERKVQGISQGPFDIKYQLTLPRCPCNPEQTAKIVAADAGPKDLDPKRDETGEGRVDCERVMLEYNKLSIEYGKRQADLRRNLAACDSLDDGTVAGGTIAANCKVLFIRLGVGRVQDLREEMLDLLSSYRSCVEGKPSEPR